MINKIINRISFYGVLLCLCLSILGCGSLQLNLPVTIKSAAPRTEGELWIYKDDTPTPNNRRGSFDWHQEPICRGCTIVLGAWFIEKSSNSPRPVKATWEIRKGEKDIISITPLEGGHKVIIRGLRSGTVRDILVRSEEGHQIHLFDITVK
ncbi:MAG: hypothetical protein KKF00_08025 [Proteobacteria bacterium]|nr:hypothetical protein [Pseudomonadota bacterium]